MTRIFYFTLVKPACCVSKISPDGGCQSKETGVGMEVRFLSVGARGFFSRRFATLLRGFAAQFCLPQREKNLWHPGYLFLEGNFDADILRYQCTPKLTILPNFSYWYSQVHLIEFFQLQKVLRKKVSPKQSYKEKTILWINYLDLEAVNKLSWSIKVPLKVT